jgi:hypothetical protein
VPLQRFVWQFATCSAVLSGAIVALLTGKSFLAQTQVLPQRRRFVGTVSAYLWQRHALPQGLLNAVLAGVAGAAIMPATLGTPGAVISAEFVRRDMIGTLCGLGIAIAAEVYGYAQFERRWGVAPVLESSRVRLAHQIACSAIAFAVLTGLACALTGLGVHDVSVSTFLVGRTLGCGAYGGWIAYCLARWLMLAAPTTGTAARASTTRETHRLSPV